MSQRHNEYWAGRLGWSPADFGCDSFGLELNTAIRSYQDEHGLVVDGICGPNTWRRLQLEQAPEVDDRPAPPAGQDAILVRGQLLPVPWERIVTPGEDGAFEITQGMRRWEKKRPISMVVTHWDVCLDAAGCYAALRGPRASTHFVIDYDGTVYQFMDANDEAWHAGLSRVNRCSVGIDLNTPVYTKYQAKLVKRGQPERPVLSGYKVGGWNPGEFLGFHQVQIDAYAALLAGLLQHGVIDELTGPLSTKPTRMERHTNKSTAHKLPQTVVHHGEILPGKWDALGLDIAAAIETAKAL